MDVETGDLGADKNYTKEELRADKEFAREVLEFLLPDEDVRKHCLEFLANSIRIADEAASARWGITLYDDLVLMNCGKIEVMQILPDQMHVLVFEESLPDLSSEQVIIRKTRNGQAKGFYPSVPGSIACDFDAEKAFLILPQIATSHKQLVQKAAQTAFFANRKNAHSPGVIKLLNDYLNHSLPQPNYLEDRQECLLDFESEGEHSLAEPRLPEELAPDETYSEGAAKQILVNAYERDPKARIKCIAYYGTRCIICKMSFEEQYGSIGKDFIHVHHLTPLSSIGGNNLIDPIKDLRPVCANCHAIIHRKNPPYSIEEVVQMIDAASKRNLKTNDRK